jgi:DNA-directed RNA polymerase specialized sigma24 family protein
MLEVRMALRQLTSDQRRVFVMADVIGHTHDEIARELAIPPGTSKWRLAQARRHLQRALSNRNKTERRSVRTAPLPQTSRSDF